MKDIISKSIKPIIKDKPLFGLIVANIIFLLILTVFLLIITPHSEVQIITRYNSYSITSFYRDHWYSLLSYVFLSFIIVVGHAVIAIKLVRLERRDLAVALLWLTIVLLGLLLLFAKSIMAIAALG